MVTEIDSDDIYTTMDNDPCTYVGHLTCAASSYLSNDRLPFQIALVFFLIFFLSLGLSYLESLS